MEEIDEGDVLDMNLSHFHEVHAKNLVSLIFFGSFAVIESSLRCFDDGEGNRLESFVNICDVTVIFKF